MIYLPLKAYHYEISLYFDNLSSINARYIMRTSLVYFHKTVPITYYELIFCLEPLCRVLSLIQY